MAHLFEGNKWNTLGGASVICVSIFMLIYLVLGQTIFYRFSHTNPNANMLSLESNKVRN